MNKKIKLKCHNCDLELIQRKIDPIGVLHCPKCSYNIIINEKKAEYLYAVLSVDKNGYEGIVGTKQFGMIFPAVSMKKDMIDFLFDDLKNGDIQVRIAKFKRVEE